MGLFLCMSSVVGADKAAVAASLQSFIKGHGGTFREDPTAESEDRTAFIAQSARGTSVLYPVYFEYRDEASAHLSTNLGKPVFSFHEHDGDFWMFTLFVNGEPAARFNPIPEYWGELDEDEAASWLPSEQEIAAHVPGVDATTLSPYLVRWPDDGSLDGKKAHADDEFTYGEDWQLTDFMRRLGFVYPEPDGADVERYFLKAGRGR